VQLRAAKALFAGSARVSRREWQQFARTFQQSGSDAAPFEMAWIPRVDDAGLKRLAELARADGLDTFELHSSAPRDFYCPIFYNEPAALHADSIGRDVCTSPRASAAMQRARQTRTIVMSDPVGLGTSGAEPQSGYVLFAWVDSDSEQSSGWVAGTVTMSQLFAASLPGQADVSVRVR